MKLWVLAAVALLLFGCISISGFTGGETTPTPLPCPSGCSGHGTCSAGVCACNPGWSGVSCSVAATPAPTGTPAPTATPTTAPSATPTPITTATPGGCGSDTDCRANQFCNTTTRICACREGWGNCDMIIENGCETNLYTSATHCGSCATVCAGGKVCSIGTCISTKKGVGEVCASDSECTSGNCYPAQTGKRCAPSGKACPACQVIDAAGTACVDATSGSDPKDDCPTTGESTCGTTGKCGAGACLLWGERSVCEPASCLNNFYTAPGRCDGAGTCGAGNRTACDDDDVCTTDDCSSATGCTHVAVDCDDGNDCTVDSCVRNLGCQHTAAPSGTHCGRNGLGVCDGELCIMPI